MKTKSKVNGPHGHGIRIKNGIKVIKRATKGEVGCQVCGKSGHQTHQCWWNQSSAQSSQTSTSQLPYQNQSSRQVCNMSEYPQDQPTQTLQHDHLKGFQDLRPVAQQQSQTTNRSVATSHYGSVSSVLHHPGQVRGFSRHRLNINHFTQPFTSQTQMGKMCSSLLYPTGPLFRNLGQHSSTLGRSLQLPQYHSHLMFILRSTQVSG